MGGGGREGGGSGGGGEGGSGGGGRGGGVGAAVRKLLLHIHKCWFTYSPRSQQDLQFVEANKLTCFPHLHCEITNSLATYALLSEVFLPFKMTASVHLNSFYV